MSHRYFLAVQDEFYNRYITRNGLFEPVMTAFFENGSRYNLLNSAVLEMVDYIRRENIKALVVHLTEHFSSRFSDVDYVPTFKQLLLRHEQVGQWVRRRKPAGLNLEISMEKSALAAAPLMAALTGDCSIAWREGCVFSGDPEDSLLYCSKSPG